jgi:thiamine pyrophosphate-dependent acetolactate synthase large subunit-like protein
MDRHVAITHLIGRLNPDDLLLTTTGMISREAFYTDDRPATFYMIGSMGLLSALGLGLALLLPNRRIVVVDGDGSYLMTLGNIPLIGYEAPKNLWHIVLDNGSYQSTGAQPTISTRVDLGSIAQASGYRTVVTANGPESLDRALDEVLTTEGPSLLHVRINISQVDDIPRVSHTPTELRDRFQKEVLAS